MRAVRTRVGEDGHASIASRPRLAEDAWAVHATAQVGRAFALMFGRAPSREEIADSTALIAQHGLAAFCRALFNANEFIRLD